MRRQSLQPGGASSPPGHNTARRKSAIPKSSSQDKFEGGDSGERSPNRTSPVRRHSASPVPMGTNNQHTEWLVPTVCVLAPLPAPLKEAAPSSIPALEYHPAEHDPKTLEVTMAGQPGTVPTTLQYNSVIEAKPCVDRGIGGHHNHMKLAASTVQDLFHGYNCSLVCQGQHLSEESVANAPDFSPVSEFLHPPAQPGEGFIATFAALLFHVLNTGQGSSVDIEEVMRAIANPVTNKNATASAARWNYSVEASYVELFQEEFSDLLVVPPPEHVAKSLRIGTRNALTPAPSTPPAASGSKGSTLRRKSSLGKTALSRHGSTVGPKDASSSTMASPPASPTKKQAPPIPIEVPEEDEANCDTTGGWTPVVGSPLTVPDNASASPPEIRLDQTMVLPDFSPIRIDGDEEEPADDGHHHRRVSSIPQPEDAPAHLKVRTHPEFGPFVEGAQTVMVESAVDLMNLIAGGVSRRIDMTNRVSALAHSVLRLTIRQTSLTSDTCLTSVFTLADMVSQDRLATPTAANPNSSMRGMLQAGGARAAFLRAKKAIASSLAFRRVLQLTTQQTGAPSAKSHNAQNSNVTVMAAAKDSQLTALLAESFGGNVKTRFLTALYVPQAFPSSPSPEETETPKKSTNASSSSAVVESVGMQAALNSLRLLGRRVGAANKERSCQQRMFVKPNTSKATVATQTLQQELMRLKRELKEDKKEMTEAQVTEMKLQLESKQALLDQVSKKKQAAEEKHNSLKALCEKQRAALKQMAEELEKKSEMNQQKVQLAVQVDSFLKDQHMLKSKLEKERKETENAEAKLTDLESELKRASSLRRRRVEATEKIAEDNLASKQQAIAEMFSRIVETHKVKEETATLKKANLKLKAKRGVLNSSVSRLQKKIDACQADMDRSNQSIAAMDDHLDQLCEHYSTTTADKDIRQLSELIDLTEKAINQHKGMIATAEEAEEALEANQRAFMESDEMKELREQEASMNELLSERSARLQEVSKLEYLLKSDHTEIEVLEEKIAERKKEAEELREIGSMAIDAIALIGPMNRSLELEITTAEDAAASVDQLLLDMETEFEKELKEIKELSVLHDRLCDVAAEKLVPS